jgi:hypothetical protein
MKIGTHWAHLALVIAVLWPPRSADAQIFSFDESGRARRIQLGIPDFRYTGEMRADPQQGGLASALTFEVVPVGLTGNPIQSGPMIGGDIVLRDPDGHLSEVIRFTPSPGPGFPATVIFYSDAEDDDSGSPPLADTGFPATFSDVFSFNEVRLSDGSFGVAYAPDVNEPGSFVLIPGRVSYIFISDTDLAPEPATIVLLGSGLAVAGALVWRGGLTSVR